MNLTVILCSIKILLWLVNSLCLHDHKLSSRLMFGYIEFDLMTVAHKSECWLQHPRITEITQLNFSIFKLSISVCVHVCTHKPVCNPATKNTLTHACCKLRFSRNQWTLKRVLSIWAGKNSRLQEANCCSNSNFNCWLYFKFTLLWKKRQRWYLVLSDLEVWAGSAK